MYFHFPGLVKGLFTTTRKKSHCLEREGEEGGEARRIGSNKRCRGTRRLVLPGTSIT